jgi:hypothetical protein
MAGRGRELPSSPQRSGANVVQRALGLHSTTVKGRGVKLTTHLHIVPRLRMLGAISLFPINVFKILYLIKHWTTLLLSLRHQKHQLNMQILVGCIRNTINC